MMHFSEIIYDILDPFLHRRAGINMSLIGAWGEIVGEAIARHCRPEKIIWPIIGDIDKNGTSENVGGILVIACQGAYAPFLMHDQEQVIRSVNDFFGFCAIKKIRIVQKAMCVANHDCLPVVRSLSEDDLKKIDKITKGIENKSLKKALIRFGHAVFGSSYL